MSGVTVQIRAGYLGQCTAIVNRRECRKDAEHFEYFPYDNPIPSVTLKTGQVLPEVRGIWAPVCKAHCNPNRDHEQP